MVLKCISKSTQVLSCFKSHKSVKVTASTSPFFTGSNSNSYNTSHFCKTDPAIVSTELLKYCPDAIVLVAGGPVAPVSGFSKKHVIGIGTNLASGHRQHLLSNNLRATRTSCNGCTIGKRGMSSGKIATIEKLFQPFQKKSDDNGHKVTVVGIGQVGIAAVFSMLTQNVTNNIAMVDMNPDKLKAEMMDLQHGLAFIKNAKIQASTDYSITADSRIIVVTAGVRQREGETRLDLVQRNTDVMKIVIPQLVKYSPKAIFLLASNPVDVLTYVTWKISGLPKQRVIGSGTNLDSARFRFLISEKLGIATSSCHGFIIGEHGNSAVPVWSGVNVAGVRLRDLNQNIGKDWNDIIEKVLKSPAEVRKLKGHTNWAVGLSITDISKAILFNLNTVHAVSTIVKGEYGIEDDVFMSLPCVLSHFGIADVVRQTLTDSEAAKLRESAQILAKIQAGVKF